MMQNSKNLGIFYRKPVVDVNRHMPVLNSLRRLPHNGVDSVNIFEWAALLLIRVVPRYYRPWLLRQGLFLF